MRALMITIVLIALWVEAPPTSADAINYMKMSKTQLVDRLGLPTQISLFAGPEPEMWHYYYTHDDGVVLMFVVGFREGRLVACSYDPMFECRRILSPDRPADLAKIWRYIREDRGKLRRAKSR
ncbi:MAG TPA: hypothetical protein VGM65_03310 [Candidatus Udaeobacter sp.]|jgi:hypothetical protein